MMILNVWKNEIHVPNHQPGIPISPIMDSKCHHISSQVEAKVRLRVDELRQHRQSEEALSG